MKSVHFPQILSIVLAIVAYYAGIMLNPVTFPLCSKLCWHNRLKPVGHYTVITEGLTHDDVM